MEQELVREAQENPEGIIPMDVDYSMQYSRLQQSDANDGEYLPANDSESDTAGEDDEEDNNDDDIRAYLQNQPPPVNVPPITSSDSELEAQVWKEERAVDTIELNEEKTQQILTAMSKFTLPNIPSCYNEINTSELLQRIKQSQGSTSSNNTK